MERLQKKTEVLNDLVRINKDFTHECEQMTGGSAHACSSMRMIQELEQLGMGCLFELRQFTDIYLGDPADVVEVRGDIYKKWQEDTIPFTSFDPRAICSCCENKATALKNCYINALQKANDLPDEVNRLLGYQLDRIYAVVFSLRKYNDEFASSN